VNIGARIQATLRAVLCLAWVAVLLPPQMVAYRFGWRLSRTIPMLYHRGNCWIMGITVECRGRPSDRRPTLFVSNHTSYIDIIVLAAVIDAAFIAKSEVAGWPIFGLLAKLNGTVFVERRASRAKHHRDEMQRRLDAGDSLVLFPEGTSNDGQRVLRFVSTFFSIAERDTGGQPLLVQPVSIAYTQLDGLPMGRRNRLLFAWYGDMELMDHLWTVLGLGRATVGVTFHEPVTIADFASRKEMALGCQAVVAAGVSDMLSGREAAPASAAADARLTADRPVLESNP
jgi:1-acyl-sn-glycerol-3-phosphate acyltransferase